MGGSDLGRRARRCALMPVLATAALVAVAPAHASFPGKPGPIAYPTSSFGETGPGEFAGSGGLVAHGPRKRSGPRTLTGVADDKSPAYSADGRLIAFESGRERATGEKGAHIFVVRSDGSDVRQLTSGEFEDSNPAFSPNGRQVVFDRSPLYGGASHIFRIGIDGSGLRQLTGGTGNDADPTYTPNGRVIVFVSNRRRSGRRDSSNIFSMRANGSRIRLLIGGPRADLDPDVSPNGHRIAFASTRDHGHGPNIFIARLNGRHVRELTHSRHDCFGSACYTKPSWAPDGKHIAYLSRGRYSSSIDVMRTDGHGYAKEFAEAGTEEEGYGSTLGAPSWGVRPR